MAETFPLDQYIPDDPLMAAPWLSAFGVAILNKDIMAAFKAETGLSWNPPKSPIEQMVDEATGYQEEVIVAFAAWFNANVWGDPKMDHTGKIEQV
jgi:hypothetical protein